MAIEITKVEGAQVYAMPDGQLVTEEQVNKRIAQIQANQGQASANLAKWQGIASAIAALKG